ncbi:unnamed protein product, partial [Prunus brigantina]
PPKPKQNELKDPTVYQMHNPTGDFQLKNPHVQCSLSLNVPCAHHPAFLSRGLCWFLQSIANTFELKLISY